jgi:hypothetical protein
MLNKKIIQDPTYRTYILNTVNFHALVDTPTYVISTNLKESLWIVLDLII